MCYNQDIIITTQIHRLEDKIHYREEKILETTISSKDLQNLNEANSQISLGVFDLIALSIGTAVITIFTLGLAYPAAAVIKERYLKDRTIISNRKLKFDASAGDLYITYIKWMILVFITFGIYIFWLNRNILRWKVSNTNFVDRKDTEKESFFDGTVGGLFVTNLLTVLMIIFSLGIALPWALSYKTRYVNNHTIINGSRLEFKGTGSNLFGKFIVWLLLTIATFGIYALWLNLNIIKWEVRSTSINKLETNLENNVKEVSENMRLNKMEQIPLFGYLFILYVYFIIIIFQNYLLPFTDFTSMIIVTSILFVSISLSLTLIVASFRRLKKRETLVRSIVFLIIAIIIFVLSITIASFLLRETIYYLKHYKL